MKGAKFKSKGNNS